MKQNHQTLEICRFVFRETTRNNHLAYYCVRLKSYLDEFDPFVSGLIVEHEYSSVRLSRLGTLKTAWYDKHGNIIIRYTRRKNG